MFNLLFGVFVQTEDSRLKYDYFYKNETIFFLFFFLSSILFIYLCMCLLAVCVTMQMYDRHLYTSQPLLLGWQNHEIIIIMLCLIHVRVLFSFSCIFKCLWFFSSLFYLLTFFLSDFFWEEKRGNLWCGCNFHSVLLCFDLEKDVVGRCVSAPLRWHMPKLIERRKKSLFRCVFFSPSLTL